MARKSPSEAQPQRQIGSRVVVVTYTLPADAQEKAEACRDILRQAARNIRPNG